MTRPPAPAHLGRTSIHAAVVALALCAGSAFAQDAAAPSGDLAARLREQQQQLEQQRLELERQRQALEQQQRQLEALAAALEQQMKGAPPAAAAATATAQGQQPGAPAGAAAATPGEAQASASGRGSLRWAGYGEMSYQRYDFYANTQTAKATERGRTDIGRFVLSPHMNLGGKWSLFGEIEFEHGGTGSTVEYEAEETGEYEAEIEKGGEIVLEQLWLQYSHSPALNVRFGELVVPVGMVNLYHQPTEFFTIERSLAETSLIPSVWHETGVQVLGTIGQLRYQVLGVTALDSTGFSGHEFVRGGMQRKLETKNADAFAFAAHAEYAFAPGVLVGGAFYAGDSAPNRPRQNLSAKAFVTLGEVHGRYEVGPWTVRGQVLLGQVQNSRKVTQANFNTFNGGVLGVSRTPVGKRAKSFFVEAGYDVLSLWANGGVPGRLDLFARYEDYDTHADTAPGIARVPRYHRKAATVGLNYKPQPGIVIKGEYSRRSNDGLIADKQDVLGVAAGFEF
ncbi:hypothetical protein [Piscinibacter sp.]|uniref:hypothetical protein n=1 Tax=Piscinibacter sp. TaxID=1903157 RepID=UPI0039E222A7